MRMGRPYTKIATSQGSRETPRLLYTGWASRGLLARSESGTPAGCDRGGCSAFWVSVSCALALSQGHSLRQFIFPLVVKNDVKKGTVNLQIITAVIVDEPQFPKPVHEVADSCASCTHHLR